MLTRTRFLFSQRLVGIAWLKAPQWLCRSRFALAGSRRFTDRTLRAYAWVESRAANLQQARQIRRGSAWTSCCSSRSCTTTAMLQPCTRYWRSPRRSALQSLCCPLLALSGARSALLQFAWLLVFPLCMQTAAAISHTAPGVPGVIRCRTTCGVGMYTRRSHLEEGLP